MGFAVAPRIFGFLMAAGSWLAHIPISAARSALPSPACRRG